MKFKVKIKPAQVDIVAGYFAYDNFTEKQIKYVINLYCEEVGFVAPLKSIKQLMEEMANEK